MKQLSESGIDCHAVSGKGYRLPFAVDLLSDGEVLQSLSDGAKGLVRHLEVHFEIGSTNEYLMKKAHNDPSVSGYVCFAEQQSTGRGRRGRHWVSPFGGNIYVSVLWQFAMGPAALTGLSLALGVAVVNSLNKIGIMDVGLKWPNDVIWREGKKLAGILLEMVGEASGPCRVVAGLGLNVRMPDLYDSQIDQPWTDITSILEKPISRNYLAGVLLQHIVLAMDKYGKEGLAGFLPEWKRLDILTGKRVVLHLPQNSVSGVAEGVDDMGALQIRLDNGELKKFTSGEISVRSL